MHRFSVRRLPIDCLTTRGAWGFFGEDVVTGLRGNASTRFALEELAALDLRTFEEVACLSDVNHRRQDAAFRVTALIFVVAPVVSGLLIDLFAPKAMGMVRSSEGWKLPVLVVFAALLLLRLAALWRARQLTAVIEIARVEQGRPLRRSGQDPERGADS